MAARRNLARISTPLPAYRSETKLVPAPTRRIDNAEARARLLDRDALLGDDDVRAEPVNIEELIAEVVEEPNRDTPTIAATPTARRRRSVAVHTSALDEKAARAERSRRTGLVSIAIAAAVLASAAAGYLMRPVAVVATPARSMAAAPSIAAPLPSMPNAPMPVATVSVAPAPAAPVPVAPPVVTSEPTPSARSAPAAKKAAAPAPRLSDW